MMAILIEVFCNEPKVNQLKLMKVLFVFVIAIISQADVVGLKVVVDVADAM